MVNDLLRLLDAGNTQEFKNLLTQNPDVLNEDSRRTGGETLLCKACSLRDSNVLEFLLTFEDLDLNLENGYRESPMMIAYKNSNFKAIDLLMADQRLDATKTYEEFYNYQKQNPTVSSSLLDQICLHPTFDPSIVFGIACKEGDQDTVEKCLAAGTTDINKTLYLDLDYHTPLYLACAGGHAAVVKALLTANSVFESDLFALEFNPEIIAILSGNERFIKSLADDYDREFRQIICESYDSDLPKIRGQHDYIDINRPDDREITLLHLACKNEKPKILIELLKFSKLDLYAADKENHSALFYACSASPEIIDSLISDARFDFIKISTNELSLFFRTICKNGQAYFIIPLLSTHRIDINALDEKGKTPLQIAKENRQYAIVDVLLNPDITSNSVKTAHELNVFFRAACEQGEKNTICAYLATKKININECDAMGRTPLEVAIDNEYTDIIAVLLNHGAKIEVNNSGFNALFRSACARGEVDTVVSYLAAGGGIAINEPDARGKTPLEIAIANNHNSIINVLLKHNATISANQPDTQLNVLFRLACKHRGANTVTAYLATGRININEPNKIGANTSGNRYKI